MTTTKTNSQVLRPDAEDNIELELSSHADVTNYPYPSNIRDHESQTEQDDVAKAASRAQKQHSKQAAKHLAHQIENWEDEGGRAQNHRP